MTCSRGLSFTKAVLAVQRDAAECSNCNFEWITIEGLPLPKARHECVRRLRALEAERGTRFDYVLLWDDDQAPPPGTLSRYLAAMADAPENVAMVTGQTWVRRGEQRLQAVTPLKPSDNPVQYARGAGLFYALLRREVLDTFDVERIMTRAPGEDWLYTTALVAAGRRILLLADIEIPHLRLVRLHDKERDGWNGCHVIEEQ